MALNWDLSKIRDHEALWVETGEKNADGEPLKRLNGITESFIWLSLVTGLGKGWTLTEEFAPEFYARIRLLDKLDGPLVSKGKDAYDITIEDVQRHIGLHTNAGTKTRAEFIRNAVTSDLDAWKRAYAKEVSLDGRNAA